MRDEVNGRLSNNIKVAVIDYLKPGAPKATGSVPPGRSKDETKQKQVHNPTSLKEKLYVVTGEFIGTTLLLFLGCMGCISGVDNVAISHHFSSIAFGLVVMTLILIFGHISAAHFNPAVTLASFCLGYTKIILVPFYIVSQFAGAILGFLLLKLLVPTDLLQYEGFNYESNKTEIQGGVCSTVPYASTSSLQALIIEVIITMVLILVCAGVWDKRNADKTDSIPLKFGFVISVIGMVAGPFTGASMNTARTLGPAIFNNEWKGHWIYWVGPNVGGIFGAYLYKVLWGLPNEEEEPEIDFENFNAANANSVKS